MRPRLAVRRGWHTVSDCLTTESREPFPSVVPLTIGIRLSHMGFVGSRDGLHVEPEGIISQLAALQLFFVLGVCWEDGFHLQFPFLARFQLLQFPLMAPFRALLLLLSGGLC